MKTAEEIADELAVYSRRDNVGAVALKGAIEKALTAYAEELVKEALDATVKRTSDLEGMIKHKSVIRAEALEDAAKIAESHDDCPNRRACGKEIGDEIRALAKETK